MAGLEALNNKVAVDSELPGQQKKCPECPPRGLPGWMATFADMVTLLLTFFILLLSFAKTESAKYEAALGSIRNAFGGNVLQQGEVIQKGKSPDDNPTMIESQKPIRPFPIDYLTQEGFLDKHEINRESDEELELMRADLADYDLSDVGDTYEVAEGIRVHLKDKIYFSEGESLPSQMIDEVYDRLLQMLSKTSWVIHILGHASRGEIGNEGQDALALSSDRAKEIAGGLIKRGILPKKITISFYGDSKAKVENPAQYRRVDLIIRKRDVNEGGRRVDSR